MFKKLFQNIFSNHSDDLKSTYNDGVAALKKGYINDAITIFKQIAHKHQSAAYNLGLIYLDGDGKFLPNYPLSQEYLNLAISLGHPKAPNTAQIINAASKKLRAEEYIAYFIHACSQFTIGRQIGNLAYLISNDIIYNVIETSTNKLYSVKRFIDYEVWCIINYGSDEVKKFFNQSELVNYYTYYDSDWEEGDVAVISDYLNTKVIPNIITFSDGKIKLTDTTTATLRMAVVNYIYQVYSTSSNPALMG